MVDRDLDEIAWREELVEAFDELGVATEQFRYPLNDTWHVDAAAKSEWGNR